MTFLNTLFLAGLAAAGIPILIHMMSRRKAKKVPFSSVQFLTEIHKERIRRVRIQEFLLLALRVLIVALIALALGRPAVRADIPIGKKKGLSAAVLLLDNSYSMGATSDDGVLFELARSRAEEVLGSLEDGDEITILPVSDGAGGSADVSPERSVARARANLKTLALSARGTDFPAMLAAANEILRKSASLNKEIYLLSDFQRSGFGERSPESLARMLEPGVRVYFLPVLAGRLANVSLDQTRLAAAGGDIRISARATNHSDETQSVVATARVGGEVAGEGRMELTQGETGFAAFPLTAGSGREIAGEVAVPPDAVEADNVRYFAASGTESARILVVEGGREDRDAPPPFLTLALGPSEGSRRFDATTVAPADLARTLASTHVPLVILSNVPRLDGGALSELKDHVRSGGKILVALGDRTDVRSMNEEFLPALFPARLREVEGGGEDSPAFFTLHVRAGGHPIFAGFRTDPGEPLSRAHFWKILRADPATGARVLAQFADGRPAVLESNTGLLLTSSLDGRWNNFPLSGAFLPLLHQMVDYLAGGEGEHGGLVGYDLSLTAITTTVRGATIDALGPGGESYEVRSKEGPEGTVLSFGPVERPGLYTIRRNGTGLARIAANVDTREASLDPLPPAELLARFPGKPLVVIPRGEAVADRVRQSRFGRELWREFLVLALLLMILELWLGRAGIHAFHAAAPATGEAARKAG